MRYILAICLFVACPLRADTIQLSDASGLSAEVEFALVDSTTLEVRVRNTSTGVPDGFGEDDQLLTGVSWDFGMPGANAGEPEIVGGSVLTGASSMSLNFDVMNVGANADVSGEYGFGNNGGSGALINFVSGNTAQATAFGGTNLDGPTNLNGPQGGLVADPVPVALAGLGAIQDEIVATLTLDQAITEQFLADSLEQNLVRIEYGSDAAFLTTPEPATLVCLLLGIPLVCRRRSNRV